MLLFYVGLYGLALFLCFLGLLFAITEKIYKWFTSNAKKSHSSKCFEVTSSCSNYNDISEKLASRSLKKIEENNLEDSLKVLEVSENSYNQEDNENQLSDSDISTPTDEMKTIMNERSIDDNHNEIQLTMDTKSFSERRQERRKRYKAKKGYNLSTTGQFSIDSSLDDYNTSTMKNTMIEELDEAKNASDCPVLSDSNDSQLDYFILETHNMCELINSIEITNLDDGEVDVNDNNNAKNNNDSLDDLLKINVQYCNDDKSELKRKDWILLVPKYKTIDQIMNVTSFEMKQENQVNNKHSSSSKENFDINMKSKINDEYESNPPALTSDSSIGMIRRLSLRSKRSFDCSFESWDENYFSTVRKISQMDGVYYVAFNSNKDEVTNSPELVNLIEDQEVICLDADNPDKWVVRVHSPLQKIGSIHKQIKKENTLTDSKLIDVNDTNDSIEMNVSVSQESQINNEKLKRIGRIHSVCLTRNLKSAQRGKRNPREAFREDVISFSNKQQESRMKMRYTLTELSDTELEYSRALRQLSDVLDSLNGKLILNYTDGLEKTIDYPKSISDNINGLQVTLKRIIQLCSSLLENLPSYALDPGKAAECFTKTPDRWYDYTIFLIHLDYLLNHILQITSQDVEISFSLSIPDTIQKVTVLMNDQVDNSTSSPTSSNEQRNNISVRNLLDLLAIPRNRLNAYGGLLRDIARYIARDGSSTRNFELAMIYVARAHRRSEEFIHFWSKVDGDFNKIFNSESGYEHNSFFGKCIPPPITRITDVKIGQHRNIQLDENEMQIERIVLLPDHLLSLKIVNEENSLHCWTVNRIMNLDELRIGEYGNKRDDETSFELWNISGADPLKVIIRIICPDIISRNAWVEDVSYAIKAKFDSSLESVNVPKSIKDLHIEAYWNTKKRYSGIMELSSYPNESISEMYYDTMENIQQINLQNVHSSHLSQLDKCELIQSTFIQKSTSSSSYYTADEQSEENGKDQLQCTNLFESYSTLDGVQTPFSEDQQSLADLQMCPENRGNQTHQLLTSSTSLKSSDNLVKQLTVTAGEQIQFNASFTISGPVAYETSWYMNGEPMKPEIGAEMILSDRDTRLLISNADPLIHSGTYSCRCRLFEGTETAVYFCVNILTAKLNQNDSNENESTDQLKLTNITQANIFQPITKELDLPLGKLLEIQVKLNEENALKLMNNSKESIQIDWYQDSTLLESNSTCEMLKIKDKFILHSTTDNFQPDKLYTFTCKLKLPENIAISSIPSLTIPVHFHYPTVKELNNEFINSLNKNKSIIENNLMFQFELKENDTFELNVPIQQTLSNDTMIVWWSYEDKLLTGSHLSSNENDYKCSFNQNTHSNEIIIKLFKSTTQLIDSGLYKCWIVKQSLNHNLIQCINVKVTVRQEEIGLNKKLNNEEGIEIKNMQEDEINVIDEKIDHMKEVDKGQNKEEITCKMNDDVDEGKRKEFSRQNQEEGAIPEKKGEEITENWKLEEVATKKHKDKEDAKHKNEVESAAREQEEEKKEKKGDLEEPGKKKKKEREKMREEEEIVKQKIGQEQVSSGQNEETTREEDVTKHKRGEEEVWMIFEEDAQKFNEQEAENKQENKLDENQRIEKAETKQANQEEESMKREEEKEPATEKEKVEEAFKKKKEEEEKELAAKMKEEEEALKKKKEEEEKKLAAKKKEEEEALKKKKEEEEKELAAKMKEEEAFKKKKEKEEKKLAAKKKEEEEALKKKKEEEEKKLAAKKKEEEEALKKKKEEEEKERAAKKKEEEEALKKKKEEEEKELAAKKKGEEALKKKKEEEEKELAAKKKEEEVALKKKREEEFLSKQKSEAEEKNEKKEEGDVQKRDEQEKYEDKHKVVEVLPKKEKEKEIAPKELNVVEVKEKKEEKKEHAKKQKEEEATKKKKGEKEKKRKEIISTQKADKEEMSTTSNEDDVVKSKINSVTKNEAEGDKGEDKQETTEERKKYKSTRLRNKNESKAKLEKDIESNIDLEALEKVKMKKKDEELKRMRQIEETGSEKEQFVEIQTIVKDDDSDRFSITTNKKAKPYNEEKQEKLKKEEEKLEVKQTSDKVKTRRESKSAAKDTDKNGEQLIDKNKLKNETDIVIEISKTVGEVDFHDPIEVTSSDTLKPFQTFQDKDNQKKNWDDKTDHEIQKEIKRDAKMVIENVECTIFSKEIEGNQLDNKIESLDVKEQMNVEPVQEPKRNDSETKRHEKDTKKRKSSTETIIRNDDNLINDYIQNTEKNELKSLTNLVEVDHDQINEQLVDTSAKIDTTQTEQNNETDSKEKQRREEKKRKREKSKKTYDVDNDTNKHLIIDEKDFDKPVLTDDQKQEKKLKKHRKSITKADEDNKEGKLLKADDEYQESDIKDDDKIEVKVMESHMELKDEFEANENEKQGEFSDNDETLQYNTTYLIPITDFNKDENVSIKQGSKVYLTTHFNANDLILPNFDNLTVYLNGKPIETNTNYKPQLIIKQNNVELLIDNIQIEQSGTYEIQLNNSIEHQLKQQNLIENQSSNDNNNNNQLNHLNTMHYLRYPKIFIESNQFIDNNEHLTIIHDDYKQKKIFLTELLPKYICKHGETLKLAVELKNNILVKNYQWLFNEKIIDPESTTDFVVWQTGNWIALTIPNVRSDLTGTYTLHIDTTSGEYYTSGDLSVNGQKLQTIPYVPSQVEGLKPLFTKKLQDYTGEINGTVRFNARLVAEPPAIVTWRHNGIQIENDDRIQIVQDGINPSLIIQNIKDEDYGEYSCSALNVLGQTETKAFLYIQSTLYESHNYENDVTDSLESTSRQTRFSVLPSRVNNLQLLDVYDDGFKIAWDPISNENVTYIVEISNDAGRWWKPVVTNSLEVSAYISNDVACPLNPVQVRVVAENEFGLGPPCFPVLRLPIRACLPHMQAVKPEYEFEEAMAIKLRWCQAVPALSPSQLYKNITLNSSQLLGKVTYAVEVREGSQSEWCRVADDITTLSYFYHLRPGISSAIRIIAKNKYGESCPSPMAIVQLDPNSLIPDLAIDPPWITINCPSDNTSGKKSNIRLMWKAAYTPEFCTNCKKDLKPMYRVEWRRGISGHWNDLASDISDCESGYPLPSDLIEMLTKETQMGNDLNLNTTNSNSSLEFRIFSYNEFGESGPTKSYRLRATQIFRTKAYRSNSQLSDKVNGMDQYEQISVMDRFPIISSDKIPRLEVKVNSVDPKEGIALEWAACTNPDVNIGVNDYYSPHGRYRIQRRTFNNYDDNFSHNMNNWTVVCKEDDLIYGEQYVLDVRPGKMEQFVRILSLQEDKEGNHIWLDTHEVLRIPALNEICPPAPSGIEVKLIPSIEITGAAGVRITWKPHNFKFPSNDNYLNHINNNNNKIDYRIEARTTLSELAPWRQVGFVSGSLGKIDDHKAEPGSQLIYRITPVNQFGEGPVSYTSPIEIPLLLTTLERCIEDLRFLIFGPNTIQLRWRLGDTIIDALGFRKNLNQSYHITNDFDIDESDEICERVKFSIEKRDGYAGDWYPIEEQINANLHNKIILSNFNYLDKDISCRIIANVDGQQTKPSRPINICIKTDFLVPDFSAFKPHVNVTSVEEYLISWDDPDVQSLFTSHILNLSIPQVLQKDTTYEIQIQKDGSTEWTTLASNLDTNHWTWNQPNPLIGYHIRILPSNQFGIGRPTRNVLISPQVVIPDLTFIRPSIELPSDILIGRVAPELVWQLPKSYSLDRTFTPFTYEVQIKAVDKLKNYEIDNLTKENSFNANNENIWRVLASGLKRNRLSLENLNPEEEYWLRIVAVTEYGRSTPSKSVKKMADLTSRRYRCTSASLGVLHEPTPTSPSFIDSGTSVVYAPIYGQLELKCIFNPVNIENETRFNWYFNGKLLDTDVNTLYPTLNQKFYSTVSKSGDTAVLHLNGLNENDFGSYICKAVHMLGTSEKEFVVKMADAPVFLEVPIPLLTVKLHSRFELPCYIDALPLPTIIWTKDSKRIVESHRTKIGKYDKQCMNKASIHSNCEFSTDATLSIEKCIYQDSGLYTLTVENIAGRIMTSCLIHIEENPVPTHITLRWTNVEKHYFVLRRLESDSFSEVRLLIDKKTNREYIGKLFNLSNPTSRINGAREMECLTRLCHKNVLKLIDALISDNVLILVCEKLSGSNLLDSVLACENWSEMATAAVIRSILEALDHIHSQGVVHYDIQPDNLLFIKKTIDDYDSTNSSNNPDLLRALASLVTDVLSQTDRHKMNVFSNLLKVIGFSSAQTYITNCQQSVSCMPPLRYRPEYVSPEILLSTEIIDGTISKSIHGYSENLGPPSDIWSLGVLTYILLVGWPPFVDYETGDILTDNILQANVPFNIPELENISNEGKDFISQLLQANPKKRPTAKECLSHPWIQIYSHSENKSEYILKKLKKYKEFYNSVHPIYIINDEKNYNADLKNRLASMARQPTPSEDTESVLSSRSSSVLGLRENSELYSESQSRLLDQFEGHNFNGELFMNTSNTNISTADDASELIQEKFNLQRQNTLTETTLLEESTYTLLKEQEKISKNIDQENQTNPVKHGEILSKFSAPVFASPLRDAYFSVHTREVRFTCQLASPPYLPEGITDHEEIIKEIYPSGLSFNEITKCSSSAAAWYLGGCLLSDGPGVSLGAEQGGWLWLCLSDLRPEQNRSVVECVVRNRAGKSRTKARLLLGDIPKPPGRPGLIDIRPTEALISWLSSSPDSNEDLIYRLDIKYSDGQNEPPSWHRLGFTVDCRYLINNLKPGVCYRVRVSAGNTFGWGNYSIASSDFRTPIASMDQSTTILPPNEQEWIFNWRQSTNIYALSDHPIALQYAVDQSISIPPPPDKILQKLNRYNGIIPSLDVLKSVCKPIRLINKGTNTKLILGKTHPMLNEGAYFGKIRQYNTSLPPRLLSKITYYNSDNNSLLKKARREAIMLTILRGSSGGMYSSFEDYISEQDNSYLFTNQRQLLPSGWSIGWLENDEVKPTLGITVMQWIPGGRLIDVLCSRVEYTEFSVMMWSQQILSALRWFYTCFLGHSHGNICPEHILVARRTSSLPDIVLTGFGLESDPNEIHNCFSAPELYDNQPTSIASDLWSVGAVIRLLLTGESPENINSPRKTSISDESTKQREKSKSKQPNDLSTSTINSENTRNTTYSQSHLNIEKLKRFSKPARKFVYNCLNPSARKRGTVDFWLDSHWFDLNADNVNNLTSVIIPTNLLRPYKTALDEKSSSSYVKETEELYFS